MIHIHATQQPNDVELLAVTYTTGGGGVPPVIRLVAHSLEAAETKVWEAFGAEKQHHTRVGYTPTRTIGFPAWPILTDPDNAHHALNLVADIEWARRQAETEPDAVETHIDQLTGDLGKSAPHFLPTLLEEIARIFADAGNLTYAKQYFTKARDAERTHNLTIDPERHTQAFTEFAALGLISAKALTQEARDAAARIDPQKAYDYFLTLLVNQAKAGVPLYTNAFEDLQFLGTNAGKSTTDIEQELVAAYLPTRGYAKTPATVLKKIVAVMPALLNTCPELGEILCTTIPQELGVGEYVAALQELNLWEPLCANPEKFVPWLVMLLDHSETKYDFLRVSNPDVLDAIVSNNEALAGLPLLVETTRYHLDYLDALTAAGTKWEPKPAENKWQLLYDYHSWFENHHRNLEFLLNRTDLHDQLLAYLLPTTLSDHCDILLAAEPTRKLVGWKLENYRKLRERATGSLDEWATLTDLTEYINDARIREFFPELVEEILHFDPAEELAERLRRGTIVEYTWPTFEKLCDDLGGESLRLSATYPWVCVLSEKHLYVLSGDVVRIYDQPSTSVRHASPTNDDVIMQYYDVANYEEKWMWANEGTPFAVKEIDFDSTYGEYTNTIDGTLYVGSMAIHEGTWKEPPFGYQAGFGPVYATKLGDQFIALPSGEKIAGTDFQKQLAAGVLPGLDLPDVVAVAAENGAHLSYKESFTTMVTEDTSQSPFGVDGDRLYGISLTRGKEEWWYVSPVGIFHSDTMFVAVKKPCTGTWYLRRDRRLGHMLYDAATDTRIAPSLTHTGGIHPLSLLPPGAFHQLKVRNEKVSAKMRSCTADEAATLIANPVRILDFAENDSVLAAAIAGIIAEIDDIDTADIHLPALDTVPQELEYLYVLSIPAPVIRPGESKLPLYSPGPEDHEHKQTSKNLRNLAWGLANPQDSGEIEIDWDCFPIIETIGREKIWLTRLATPGVPLDKVRLFCKLLHWCADYNLLGTWRQLNQTKRTNSIEKGRWENKQLFVRYGYIVLWNPTISDHPTYEEKPYTFNDELFVPKAEFKQALDDILAWHEKRHAEGKDKNPTWGEVSVTAAAAQVASVTTLTPRHWECFFTGVFDQPDGVFYASSLPWTSRITPEKASEVLGYTIQEIESCKSHYRSHFGRYQETFQGLAWHKDYLTQGPNVAAIGAAWEEMYGKPWIHFTNEMWDSLPAQFHDKIADDFHGGDNANQVSTYPYANFVPVYPDLIPVYLNLVRFVEPSSTEAKNLAERILETNQYELYDLHIPLGCEYTSTLCLVSDPEEHALRLAREGYLDSLLHYLTSGKAIEGIEEDPTASAPETVADAAETLSISTDAARYFLQLLALTRPTDTDVKKWNGWTKKQLDQATEELVAKELVVTAKRAGTGRTVFLPGGWLEKSTTGPAMEVWKAPHYLLWKDAKCRPIVETCPPLLPYPELFQEVWERYKSGDTPGYEELTTTRYRRKR